MPARLLPLLLLFVVATALSAREFVSRDGKKTLEADFISLDEQAQTVKLRLPSGKFVDAELAYFKDEDQAYFEKMLEKYGAYLSVPPAYRRRFVSEERLANWNKPRVGARADEATLEGLRWLKQRQDPDGSWNEGSQTVAMTAMALMSYLGNGKTPLSEEFGESAMKAMIFLIANAEKNKGRLARSTEDKHWCYEHAVATYALAEAYAICNGLRIHIPNLKETVQRAGQLIIDNQHRTSGGWCYDYDRDGARGGDLSISGWQIQALSACRDTKLEFEGLNEALEKAADYVEQRANPSGGFGYSGKQGLGNFGYDTLTGVGVHTLYLMGRGDGREAKRGLAYIGRKSKFEYDTEWCDLYALYYEALAVRKSAKGRLWAEGRISQLLDHQKDDGSWPAPGGAGRPNAIAASFTSNSIYRQCLCLLVLESPYR